MAHFLPPEHVRQVLKLEWPYRVVINISSTNVLRIAFISGISGMDGLIV